MGRGWREIDSGERSSPETARPAVLAAARARYRFALGACHGRAVLDIGCGAGLGMEILLGSAASVTGLDHSAETLAALRARSPRGGVRLVAGDARRLPFGEGRFGAVTAFEVIEHLDRPEALVEEARRVLREDGVLVISTPNRPVYSPRGTWLDYHVREYDAGELRRMLGRVFPSVELLGQAHRSMDARLDMHPLNRIFYPIKRRLDPGGLVLNRLRAAYVYARWGERPGDCTEERFPVEGEGVERLPILVAVCRTRRAGGTGGDGGEGARRGNAGAAATGGNA